jgi:D-glycero-D-manno-heptose 1,7-bisphosphate phosphatase
LTPGPKNKAVFLDRDGVLNRAVLRDGRPYPPACLGELELLPGVREACVALLHAGYLLVMVTNQPDIARGTQTQAAVDQMNAWIASELHLDDVRMCPHDDRDACACRKPKPGLITSAARDGSIDLDHSFLVGDRWRDIEAGRQAGVRTVLIDYGYREKRASEPTCTVQNLAQAADWILAATAAEVSR